jgi:hypothetical protein
VNFYDFLNSLNNRFGIKKRKKTNPTPVGPLRGPLPQTLAFSRRTPAAFSTP